MATHVIALGLEFSFTADAAAKQAAFLVAAELQASFAAAHPDLHLHDLCHGSLRVPSHGHTPARPQVPIVSPPDSACTYMSSDLTSTCLPLWRVDLFRGACPTTGTPAVPSTRPSAEPEVSFTTRSVDLFRSTCREAFPGFPAASQHDYCAAFSAEICTTGAPQAMRFILLAGGPARVPASLVVDGQVAAFVENSADVLDSGNVAAWAMEHTQDAVVVLARGCHTIEAFFSEPAEGDKLAAGEVALVRHRLLPAFLGRR